jgi:hypothetical protein
MFGRLFLNFKNTFQLLCRSILPELYYEELVLFVSVAVLVVSVLVIVSPTLQLHRLHYCKKKNTS